MHNKSVFMLRPSSQKGRTLIKSTFMLNLISHKVQSHIKTELMVSPNPFKSEFR